MNELDALARSEAQKYAKSTWLFGRGLGIVALIAFVSLHVQVSGLIGSHGITPAEDLLRYFASVGTGFWDVPSVTWLLGASDFVLHTVCILGEAAAALMIAGVWQGPASLAMALFYLSLVNVGGTFTALQWDTLLIEMGFVGAALLPWRASHRWARPHEPHPVARWAVFLVGFRLMFLSGLVKLKSGDDAWAHLTALDYHYWTQPLPNPLSWFVHQLPSAVHRASTLVVLLVELLIPFAIFFGALGRRIAFGALSALMVIIVLTGNFGFFNLLAIVLLVPLLDDAAVDRITPARARRAAETPKPRHRAASIAHAAVAGALVFLGIYATAIGAGAARDLPPAMLAPYNAAQPFHMANPYGLFAVMTRTRHEIAIEGSTDGRAWRSYTFAFKPNDPDALPGVSAPHMPRLDWMMWFAALGSYRDAPWLAALERRLLDAEPAVLGLFADDPFDGARPRYIRARIREYRFTSLGQDGYWTVTEARPYGPVIAR